MGGLVLPEILAVLFHYGEKSNWLAMANVDAPLTRSGLSFLTHIVHERHLKILGDWFDFLDVLPHRLITVIGEDTALEAKIKSYCTQYGMTAEVVAIANAAQLKENEIAFLRQQFETAGEDMVVQCKLDTLPYRATRAPWLADAVSQMDRHGLIFVTGSTLPFAADEAMGGTPYCRTQRVSNNFLLMRASTWRSIQDEWVEALRDTGRFLPEASIEHHCSVKDLYGLRLVNTRDWRVFHTQEWGPRMDLVRQRFQAGKALDPFLKGVQDDYMGPNSKYYMFPKEPLLRRTRVTLGRWRRAIFR